MSQCVPLAAYLASGDLRYQTGPEAEKVLAADGFVGLKVATAASEPRVTRNLVAHASRQSTPVEAVAFARQALSLIGQLWIGQDARPPNVR